jgi:hypothetical protein
MGRARCPSFAWILGTSGCHTSSLFEDECVTNDTAVKGGGVPFKTDQRMYHCNDVSATPSEPMILGVDMLISLGDYYDKEELICT